MKILLIAITVLFITLSAEGKTIVVVGDSISAGYGIDVDDGWVNLLAQKLDGDHSVVNASISGDTSGAGLARLPALLKQHQPDIVIIELGGNDGLQGFPVKIMRNNIQRMVDLSEDSGARVLLLGMRIPPNYGDRYTEAFYNSYRQIAEEKNVPLMPFFLDNVAVHPEMMQGDGIHPKANAQATMLDDMWSYLEPLLDASR